MRIILFPSDKNDVYNIYLHVTHARALSRQPSHNAMYAYTRTHADQRENLRFSTLPSCTARMNVFTVAAVTASAAPPASHT